MARADVTSGLLTAALVLCGLVVAALVYGFATRTMTPRTAPVRTEALAPRAAADSAAEARLEAQIRNRITVEVLNGSGVNGLAARTRELLRRRGFDVLEVGTVSGADTTVAAAVNGSAEDARRVAGALGLPARRVTASETRDENAATVRVTLGDDYARFAPLKTLR